VQIAGRGYRPRVYRVASSRVASSRGRLMVALGGQAVDMGAPAAEKWTSCGAKRGQLGTPVKLCTGEGLAGD
jgi:hypothetical protein